MTDSGTLVSHLGNVYDRLADYIGSISAAVDGVGKSMGSSWHMRARLPFDYQTECARTIQSVIGHQKGRGCMQATQRSAMVVYQCFYACYAARAVAYCKVGHSRGHTVGLENRNGGRGSRTREGERGYVR
jgi:hypothetical protein